MEAQGPLPYSQKLETVSDPERDEYSGHSQILFFNFFSTRPPNKTVIYAIFISLLDLT
jgi:hypothetical protein